MLSRTLRLTAAAIAFLGLLTACSGSNAGEPPASAPATTSTVSAGLRVPAPLPTDGLLNDPCSVLTRDEAAQVGLDSPGRKDTGEVNGCTWKSTRSEQNQVAIRPLPQNHAGISDIYDQKDKDVYFQPVTINGYPGVFADVQDSRPSGGCTLWLGVTDQLAVGVISSIYVGDNKNNPCGISQKFATALVRHLQSPS
ncbi:MAG TPA: DUF3558 domain-containing protein [Amycolatopsis sp.]|jgi:hypothetical protein|nr:DUF3558 domain-containing protein [Amycolatopsis sp.]